VSDSKAPEFTVNVNVEGNIGESYSEIDLLDPQVIREVEHGVDEKIQALMYGVLDKLQKQYKADAIGLSDYLNENHYRTWQKIKNDWDRGEQLFSKCRVMVKVNTKMRIIGAIDRVRPKEE